MALASTSFYLPIAAHAETSSDLDFVVVTATRVAQSSFDLPVSVDRIDRAVIHDGQLQENLSESLLTVPGRLSAESSKLRAGFAALGARLRCTFEFWRARRTPLCRRHSRHHAGTAKASFLNSI